MIIQTIFRGTAIPFDRHMSFKELKPVYSYEGCYDQCMVGFETNKFSFLIKIFSEPMDIKVKGMKEIVKNSY